ncbi:tetratricopeptide repeat protein [Streptomyces sp. HC44]|uniref:Tetratricopeptide repeat protein n=1 Tax=Streptomyces scabichelini TaxID=2711217 RepID=A0A6G4VA42_9ACTN|nr:tetratricopeptide repeat protein [Streptomyces scabichelini]NGO10949.1 tetratricopeptide repeat protein [Streptomyces scabichelini]
MNAHGNEISGGVQHAPILQGRDFTGPITITTAGAALPAHLQDPNSWPTPGSWDALSAGAHRSRPDADGNAVPPYIPRDIDADLRRRLAEAATSGGLVLLVGDSTAGKTRAAYEALKNVLPDHRVVAPDGGRDLLAVVDVIARSGARCVVWLDDMERYVTPEGLSPALFTELVRLRVPVLATLRIRQYETLVARDREDRTDAAARILRMAHPVEVGRIWSTDELRRAERCADERIEDAVAHHGVHGIAEYLAAGPALLQEWNHASRVGGHPRGAALVSAAVALARTGLSAPYAIPLLAELHEGLLAAAGGHSLRPEPFGEALTWASRVRHGATSLLVPASDTTYMPFDYLVDHATVRISREMWDEVWEVSLAHAADDSERLVIGFHAEDAGAMDVAEQAWRPLVEEGHPQAMYALGTLLTNLTPGSEEAERLLQRAADAGEVYAMSNYGRLLANKGLTDEAEALYRRAADAGMDFAAFQLGALQAELGRFDEAERNLRKAIESPDFPEGAIGFAASDLAWVLEETGRTEEAISMYVLGFGYGNRGPLRRLYDLPLTSEHLDELEQMYRRMASAGYADHFGDLAVFLRAKGRAQD